MTKLSDLHKKWIKEPGYLKEYDALEEELALMLAVGKARALRLEPSATGQAHKDDAEHDRTARKRARHAVHAHARAVCQRDRAPAEG